VGAGGTQQAPGDYFYGDLRRPFTQVVLWGLQRVLPATSTCPAAGPGIQCLPASITVPDAPVIGTATAADVSATVGWTAPVSNGGSAITSYEIVATPAAGTTLTRSGISATATSASVTGLANGTAYSLRVRAVNAVGTGALSAASNAVTPVLATPPGPAPPAPGPVVTVPRAPAIKTATAGNAFALVRWASPPNGGSSITGYSVRVIKAANGAQVGALRSATAGTTSLEVSGLANGTAVRFQVRARNAAGTGA